MTTKDTYDIHQSLISDIVTALARYGEEATDGECLDEVWGLLETAGYGEELKLAQSQAESSYLKLSAERHGEVK